MKCDGVDCVVSCTNLAGLSESFLVKTEKLDAVLHCTTHTRDLLGYQCFPWCVCDLVAAELVLVKGLPRPCNSSREFKWKWHIVGLPPSRFSNTHERCAEAEASMLLINILFKLCFSNTFLQQRVWVFSSLAHWDGVMPDGCGKGAIPDYVSAIPSRLGYFSDRKLTTCGLLVKYQNLLLAKRLCFLALHSDMSPALSTAKAVLFTREWNSHMAVPLCTPSLSQLGFIFLQKSNKSFRAELSKSVKFHLRGHLLCLFVNIFRRQSVVLGHSIR